MGLLTRLREARHRKQREASANQAAERHVQRGIEASQTHKWNTAIWEFDQAIALATDPRVLGRAHGGAFFGHGARRQRDEAMRHYEALKEIDPDAARRLEATPVFAAVERMGPVIFG